MHYEIGILRYYYNLDIVDIQFEIRTFLIFNHPGLYSAHWF